MTLPTIILCRRLDTEVWVTDFFSKKDPKRLFGLFAVSIHTVFGICHMFIHLSTCTFCYRTQFSAGLPRTSFIKQEQDAADRVDLTHTHTHTAIPCLWKLCFARHFIVKIVQTE